MITLSFGNEILRTIFHASRVLWIYPRIMPNGDSSFSSLVTNHCISCDEGLDIILHIFARPFQDVITIWGTFLSEKYLMSALVHTSPPLIPNPIWAKWTWIICIYCWGFDIKTTLYDQNLLGTIDVYIFSNKYQNHRESNGYECTSIILCCIISFENVVLMSFWKYL